MFWEGSYKKLFPLIFTLSTLIYLVIIFVEYILTSSPNKLYFLRMNLIDFPELKSFYLHRSLSIVGVDISDLLKTTSNKAYSIINSTSTVIIYASNAAETVVSQATTKVQSFSEEIKLYLPDFYSIGLWEYCQGQKEIVSYSNCLYNKILAEYYKVSQWSISVYILGIISTFLAIVFSVTTIFFS
ncbi:unnamed protein product [Penicillium salamii]|nr:unnamed protein product [Penicillium salamii]